MQRYDDTKESWPALTRAVVDGDDALREFMVAHEWTEDDVLATVKQLLAVVAAGAARMREGV